MTNRTKSVTTSYTEQLRKVSLRRLGQAVGLVYGVNEGVCAWSEQKLFWETCTWRQKSTTK
jgi:hypothetical protein